MNTLICDAIRAQRLIRFVYDGYERVAEPHLYGISTANHEVVSAYLVGGWSASEGSPGWRKYLVREMHDIQALAESFAAPREGYNPEDRQMRQIFCRLEAATRAVTEAPRAEPRA
jgi:hypothetical protein